ncbi:hypothetical protein FA15DRAFT_678097 [Coprinopsis marcescibilis]|uniref:Uncharacterized protein n=1 Tax=Coprinopsis marcescibilis TaxID=230819 RepID=A0A5C3L7K0_COPMA|nr:hypothetical protein FA15DRAFT_678097 [Coprinopsis marcescibilis]
MTIPTSTSGEVVMSDVQPTPSLSTTTTTTATSQPASASVVDYSEGVPIQTASTDHRLTFPRDFKKPAGVTIIAFKDFKERGIRLEPGPDDVEVDVLGVPTIPMTKEHSSDYCKTNTKRKRKKSEMLARKRLATNGNLPWWDQWEEREETRIAKAVNSGDGRIQKFISAALDFKNGRAWPNGIGQQTDPGYIWTKLEVFLGIIGGKSGAKKLVRQPKVFNAPGEADMSEDDDDDDNPPEDEMFVGKEKKTINFITDPETATKIFLSSYARAKGIIWSRINLEQMPRLIKFFLQFLIRSRVFPQSETGFQLASQVTDQALIELPVAYQLSADLPDNLGKAFRACWGMKAEGYKTVELDEEFLASFKQKPKEPEADKAEPEDDREDARLLVATDSGWGTVDPTSGWGKQSNEWSTPVEEEEEQNPWMVEDDLKLQLPAGISSTHTTGIVERSMRKITNLIPVPANLPPATSNAADGSPPDAGEVETELERKYPKVVLSPWLDWDGGEMPVYSFPTILGTSNGPVVDPPYSAKSADELKVAAGDVKKFDPANDDITILVEPAVFAELSKIKGGGIAATWVQILRKPKEVSSDGAPAAKKKKKSKKASNLWYLDDMGGVFPSFWSVPAA